MFYLLWELLGDSYSWLNIFRYITFRAVLAFFFCFTFVIILLPFFIRYIQKIGMQGQPIREDGPSSHSVKVGTPTMGGVVIVVGITLSSLLFSDLGNLYIWLGLFTMLSLAALGFYDDWQKICYQNPDGISSKTKLIWQGLTAAMAGFVLYLIDFPTNLNFPFFKELIVPLGIIFILFSIIVIIGSANAVNLTDGLDGLVAGPVITVSLAFGAIAYLVGNIKLSEYLHLQYVPGVGEFAVILSAVIAACLGFLWYNGYPAQVFMGDVGALALGGLLGIIAVLVKQEFLLAIAGGVFVVEALSVMIQRYYYKLTKKRVFKMAPIHHHFELLGWPETKVIIRFWIVSLLLAIIALATLKLR